MHNCERPYDQTRFKAVEPLNLACRMDMVSWPPF